jgi:hypothetical protein
MSRAHSHDAPAESRPLLRLHHQLRTSAGDDVERPVVAGPGPAPSGTTCPTPPTPPSSQPSVNLARLLKLLHAI